MRAPIVNTIATPKGATSRAIRVTWSGGSAVIRFTEDIDGNLTVAVAETSSSTRIFIDPSTPETV